MVSTVTSQQGFIGLTPGSDRTFLCGVCKFLPVLGWVSARYSGFPHQHKKTCSTNAVYTLYIKDNTQTTLYWLLQVFSGPTAAPFYKCENLGHLFFPFTCTDNLMRVPHGGSTNSIGTYDTVTLCIKCFKHQMEFVF